MKHGTRRTPAKALLRLTLMLLAGIAVGFGLLTAAFLLPVEPMEQNVLLSIPSLDGTWGSGEEAGEQVVKGYQTMQLDNTTDASMLLTAIHRSDTSAVDQALNVYTYHHEIFYPQYATLMQYGQTGLEGMEDTATTRYWLGYLIILKPLLMFLTYMDIRVLNMLVQGLMLAGILVLMQRRGLGRYTLPFALSLCCISPAITGLSLQFSTAFLVMLTAMLLMLWKPEQLKNRLSDAAFFMLTGMATSYFDFLTYPLVTFGLPFVLWLLMNQSDTPRRLWLMLLRCGAAWCAGYLGMWAGKWLLAALSGNEAFWSSVVGSIEVRTSADLRDADISRLDALKQTIMVFAKKPYLMLAGAALLGYAAAFCRRAWLNRQQSGAAALSAALDGGKSRSPGAASASSTTLGGRLTPPLILIFCALLPFLWFLVTANHAYIHAFYTSRTLAVTVFAALCLLSRACGGASGSRAARP